MSAIAGVFSRRGAPRNPGEIDRMLTVMASRGPDGTDTWTRDAVTLGHGALHATPESVTETMPLMDPATGNVIVADVRLDNRSELIAALRLDDTPAADLGDGRLLLDAYREWGDRCVSHLLGDFAFAIWDERRRQLFLARDHFGVKPLTYHCSERLVAFASDSRSVVVLEHVPTAINRDRVLDYLVDATEWIDTESTFFAGVSRLPPAHSLSITASNQRLRRYWHLPEPEMLRFALRRRVRGSHSRGARSGRSVSAPRAFRRWRRAQRRHRLIIDRSNCEQPWAHAFVLGCVES